eukprot:GHVT01081250.1.p1 GENE.GHVT01081250.1~~GHVT01081250.1.p1  ORF type:complete len:279 (-),score=25.54 GHVT01081250.1:5443-6279(-)
MASASANVGVPQSPPDLSNKPPVSRTTPRSTLATQPILPTTKIQKRRFLPLIAFAAALFGVAASVSGKLALDWSSTSIPRQLASATFGQSTGVPFQGGVDRNVSALPNGEYSASTFSDTPGPADTQTEPEAKDTSYFEKWQVWLNRKTTKLSEPAVEWIVRLLLVILTLGLNSVMLLLSVEALKALGASRATVLNFAFAFLLSRAAEYLFADKTHEPKTAQITHVYFQTNSSAQTRNWWLGAGCMLAGIALVSLGDVQKDKNTDNLNHEQSPVKHKVA